MAQRITDKDVQRAFTRAGQAARAAGLNTEGWRLDLGSPSVGISYSLATGQHGSTSIELPSFGHLGKTAREAETILLAFAWAWEAEVHADLCANRRKGEDS